MMGIQTALNLGPALAQSEARIVVAGPATGRHAETLTAMSAGARRGGGGADLLFSEVDDGCDAGRAEGAARLIVADRPDLVIGHPCPAAAIAAASVYAKAGVVFIALGVRHPALTAKRAGPTIFRLAGRDDRQGAAAAAALAALAPNGAIAIVQDRTAYARGLTADVTAALAAMKLPAPVVVPIVAGRRAYDAELAKLKPAVPEALFFAGYPPEAALVLRGLRKAQIGSAIIASDANATDDFARVANEAANAHGAMTAAVQVMVRESGSGGLTPLDLEDAAARAITAWRRARESGDVVSGLVADDAASRALFEPSGDARMPSFSAVPLTAGRWPKSAEARD
jgi:branched-chain amino acid transport system substrate-binding protein